MFGGKTACHNDTVRIEFGSSDYNCDAFPRVLQFIT